MTGLSPFKHGLYNIKPLFIAYSVFFPLPKYPLQLFYHLLVDPNSTCPPTQPQILSSMVCPHTSTQCHYPEMSIALDT